MSIAAVIIAGGKSTRMGGAEKAFLPLAGKPLITHIIECIAPQVAKLAINANGAPARFSLLRLPVIPDVTADVATPLAGLEAALLWAKAEGAEFVLTIPSDTPFLPADLVSRLSEAGAPAMAQSAGQQHYLTALWPTALGAELSQSIRAGLRPVKAWAKQCAIRSVPWPASGFDPFFNINTPEDLAWAERELGTRHA